MKKTLSNYKKWLKPFLYLGGFYCLVSIILRIIFIFHPITTDHFSVLESLQMIGFGLVNDAFVFVLISSLFALYLLFISNKKYKKPWGWIILSLLILAMLYVKFYPRNIFKQYGGGVSLIVMIFLGIKTVCFACMLLLPKYRDRIRKWLYFLTLFLYTAAIILNAVSEYFFWNEFGMRYNFIAVDYLVYTNEVIGNIMQSYPVIPLFVGIGILSLAVSLVIFKKTGSCLNILPKLSQKMILLAGYLALAIVSYYVIPPLDQLKSEDNFSEEIRANGVYKFVYAFEHNKLDYFKFYKTLPKKEAQKLYLSQFKPPVFPRTIQSDSAEVHKNVVLISVESLSANFLAHYGNKKNLTPFLDSLANQSLMFTNFYATGNRTVRGLEALSMNVPPTPGESIIKRTNYKGKFTTGLLFRKKGYQVKFLYGGYSSFDNMGNYFGSNGYDVIDRNAINPDSITFANIWGACDGDMAGKLIRVMNKEYQKGKPFFNHWMTVSNHRPYTYPNVDLNLPKNAGGRDRGVRYTDIALRQFFEMAKRQPWYKNTLFIIVADHCASSAGKTKLPVAKYRIPAFIFSPGGYVKPGQFNGLMSQMDLMPTVFGLLHFSYTSKFLGQGVFKPDYIPRAYIATYEDLGYIKNGFLTILSPKKKVRQFKLVQQENPDISNVFNIHYKEVPVKHIHKKLENEAIATYETVSQWLDAGKL